MLTPLLYPYLKFALGTLYPAYKTWKALGRKDISTRRRWMKYWVSFAAFQMFELVADIILAFIMPFYVEIKMAFILWLVLGTNLIYDSIVDRELKKREKAIDKWLTKLGKLRDELIALIWFEVSRCSVKIITSIFSGSLSVLARDDGVSSTRAIESEERHQDADDEEVEISEIGRKGRTTMRSRATTTSTSSSSNLTSQEYEIMEVDIDID